MVDRQHRQFVDAGLLQLVEVAGRQLVTSFEQNLAGPLVDDVDGEVAPGQLLGGDELLGEAALDQLLDQTRGHLRAGLGDDLAGGRVHEVGGDLDALHAVGVEGGLPTARRAGIGDGVVEEIEDLFLRHALCLVGQQILLLGLPLGAQRLGLRAVQGEQQRGGRQLAAAVDAHVDEILGVELEVQPGAAVRDHAGGEEVLARRVGLALVMVEEDARAAVHLGDDDALGAVDDEGAVGRHQGHVAHVDVLLLDVADRAQASVLFHVEDGEAQGHLQRGGEGHAALLALLDVVLRLLKLVLHEVEDGAVGEILDREHRPEHLLKTQVGPLLRRDVHLQEVIVGAALHLDEVGHLGDFRDAPEALPNTLSTRKGFGHGCPQTSES